MTQVSNPQQLESASLLLDGDLFDPDGTILLKGIRDIACEEEVGVQSNDGISSTAGRDDKHKSMDIV